MKKRSRILGLILSIVLTVSVSVQAASAAGVEALPTKSAVMLNGQQLTCAAYNIGGNNYFKLRDLMKALDIGVSFDGANNTIVIDTTESYVPDGSETSSPVTSAADATVATARIVLDGQPVDWAAYNIGGNNFFKLRDIGEAIDISVVWDGENDMVIIDTSNGYEDDTPDMTLEEMRDELIRLTNEEREKAGLPAFEILPELMECAQTKAQEFVDNEYFSHTSPVYGEPDEMIKAFVPQANGAMGENIAILTYTPQGTIEKWKDSGDHHANLLHTKFTHVGAGIAQDASGEIFWVLQFVVLD